MALTDSDTAIMLEEERSARTDLRQSRWRTLFALLFSSFILLYWFQVNSELLYKADLGRFAFRAWLQLPIFTNLAAWLVWVAGIYINLIREFFLRRSRDVPSRYGDDIARLSYAREYAMTRLKRQDWTETGVCFCLALQFFMIGFVMVNSTHIRIS